MCKILAAFSHKRRKNLAHPLKKTNEYTENEIEKKKDKNYGIMHLFYRPFFRFFKAYFLKAGFKDGKAGFIKAILEGLYQVVMISKIIENKENMKQSEK